jgi:hypothetical protein
MKRRGRKECWRFQGTVPILAATWWFVSGRKPEFLSVFQKLRLTTHYSMGCAAEDKSAKSVLYKGLAGGGQQPHLPPQRSLPHFRRANERQMNDV